MAKKAVFPRALRSRVVTAAVLLLLAGLWVMAPAGFSPSNAQTSPPRGGVYVFSDEVAKGAEVRGFTNRVMVRTPTYTVGAIAARDIPAHRHADGDHVLYIVSGTGTITLDGERVELRPGLIVHVPKGVVHGVRAETGNLFFVDFAQPPFSPSMIEWIR
jgi:quercetin dioxygenase-like cupin family protein